MAQIPEPLGDVATKLLFENERVKIWEMRLAPGEQGPLHQQPYDRYLEADVVPGQYFYIPRGGVEVARNVGKQAYYELLIELKD
ncbi:MAG: hypothetical protein E6J87_18025 [Deltaproteobacteria bacterium]|nr:MAG: hypothetical protein E6J87_18025 [Deltaproteobacteria bacterium]